MPRGVETSLSGVIFAARGTYKSFKKRFYESFFFEWFFGVEKRRGGPSKEWNELACGPLKEVILWWKKLFCESFSLYCIELKLFWNEVSEKKSMKWNLWKKVA